MNSLKVHAIFGAIVVLVGAVIVFVVVVVVVVPWMDKLVSGACAADSSCLITVYIFAFLLLFILFGLYFCFF